MEQSCVILLTKYAIRVLIAYALQTHVYVHIP